MARLPSPLLSGVGPDINQYVPSVPSWLLRYVLYGLVASQSRCAHCVVLAAENSTLH